jgi:hypothetical protein
MIESSDGKIDLNGLVRGLNRADLPAGRARSEPAHGSGGVSVSDRPSPGLMAR